MASNLPLLRQKSGSQVLALISTVLVGLTLAYPHGAPISTCDDLTPHHGSATAQTTSPPYTIIVSKTKVEAGGTITVTLTSNSGREFRGFLLKAISVDANAVVAGRFSTDSNSGLYKSLSCSGQPQSAITHSSADPKKSIQTTWMVPDSSGTFQFVATVVANKETFWTFVKSSQSVVVTGGSADAPNAAIPAASPTSARALSFAYNYEECLSSRSCMGFPGDCVTTRSCSMLMTFRPNQDASSVLFELISKVPINSYVAMGLSIDRAMGDDSVLQCLATADGVIMQASTNLQGRRNVKAGPDTRHFTAEKLSYANGVLRCEFSRKTNTTVGGIKTDMKNSQYHILLVDGPLNGDNTDIDYHTNKMSSAALIDLPSSDFVIVRGGDGAVPIEVIIHGSFMVIAWIGTASVAIFLARYYKDMWPDKNHCNVKIWFAWHRGLNILTLLLTIAAFILIFVSVGVSDTWKNKPVHPILGTITFILVLLQPIGAIFRPDPGTPRRPIFNWLHYLGGMLASIAGVITVFFAVTLTSAQLPTYFWWIMIAYVGFYFVMFCVMEFAGMVRIKKADKEVIPMKDVNSHDGSFHVINHTEPQGARFKEVMLLLFIAGVIGFTAALVAIIAT